MRHPVLFAFIVLIGSAITSCHSATELPPVPPTPSGFITCAGHMYSYTDAGLLYSRNQNVWYAFWSETPDSTRATLIAAINPGSIDTMFLGRDSIGWGQFWNDTLYHFGSYVSITPDSVIAGSFGIDSGVGFYLRKLQ